MLHMILGILKVIGLILGILLLLLLAVLLALILVPVRYKLTAKVLPERYAVSLRGSWLLHIVSASLSVDSEKGRRIALRLFGIRLPLFRTKDEREDDEREDGARKYSGREIAEEKRDKTQEKVTESGTQNDTEQNEAEPEQAKRNILQKIWFQCRRICGKISQIIRRLIQAVRVFWRALVSLKQRVARFGQKVVVLLRKPGELREFIEEFELREVFGGLVGHLLFLIGHYKPRRIRGYLRFGTDDPSVTGQLTGLIYLMLPARAERYSVEPQFNETVFETETVCSGHIRALHVLRVFWRAFRDKKLRRLINKLRGKGDS